VKGIGSDIDHYRQLHAVEEVEQVRIGHCFRLNVQWGLIQDRV